MSGMQMKPIFDYMKVAVIILIVSLCLPAVPVLSAAGTAIVSFSIPTQPVSPGSQFTVNITVQPNNAIAGAQVTLSFNPSLVTVNSVREGNLLNQNGASTYFIPGQINNSAGTVTGVAGAITTPGQTVSTAGTLTIITLTAGSTSGTSALSLSNVIVGDINGQPVMVSTTNNQISVNRAPLLNVIGSKNVNVGSPLTFSIFATDPDGDALTYSASNLPTGASFNTLTRSFSWTPSLEQIRSYFNVHFEVSDGITTTYENVTLTVTKVTPIFSNLSAPSINVGATSTTLSGTLKSGSLIPTGNVAITLNGVNQSATIDASGNFTSSFATSSLGTSGSPYAINYVYSGDTNFNNTFDNTKTLTVVQPYAAWDVNMDQTVNVLDMISVSQHMGESGSANWIRQDINGDGVINVLELIVIGQHWTG
jgi:hypothetical protein